MAIKRGKTDVPGVYHAWNVLSERVADFTHDDREHLLGLILRMAEYSEIELLAYMISPRRFEVLARVHPPVKGRSDAAILDRVTDLYSSDKLHLAEIGLAKHGPRTERGRALRKRLQPHGLSVWMGQIGQRMTQYLQRECELRGTIWEKRFRSHRVEDAPVFLGCAMARIACRESWLAADLGLKKNAAASFLSSLQAARAGDVVYRRHIRSAMKQTRWPEAERHFEEVLSEQLPSTRLNRIYGNVKFQPTVLKRAEGVVVSGSPKARERWTKERLKELAAYIKKGGDVNLLTKSEGGIGRWLVNQRSRYTAGKLPEALEERLTEMGVDFGPRPLGARWKDKPRYIKGLKPNQNARWNEYFEKLQAFYEATGHSFVRKGHEDYSLYIWVMRQRSRHRLGKLAQDRVDKLNALNFLWEPGNPK